jgi:hypothetical protein
MPRHRKYSEELLDRGVRLVLESGRHRSAHHRGARGHRKLRTEKYELRRANRPGHQALAAVPRRGE